MELNSIEKYYEVTKVLDTVLLRISFLLKPLELTKSNDCNVEYYFDNEYIDHVTSSDF
jgi:hypothetical protein